MSEERQLFDENIPCSISCTVARLRAVLAKAQSHLYWVESVEDEDFDEYYSGYSLIKVANEHIRELITDLNSHFEKQETNHA